MKQYKCSVVNCENTLTGDEFDAQGGTCQRCIELDVRDICKCKSAWLKRYADKEGESH